MQATKRHVKGAHDLSLKLHEWAGPSPDAPLLLLLHGFGHDSHIWEPVVPDLTRRYRVAALDLRGHGGSDRDPKFRYHHVMFGKDLAAVVPQLSDAPITLVAHSTGGHAAIGYAAREPERITRLVLLDAGPELKAQGSGGGSGRPKGDGSFESPEQYGRLLRKIYPLAEGDLLDRLAGAWLTKREDGRYVTTLDPAFTKPKPKPASASGSKPTGSGPAGKPDWDRRAWAEQGEKALAEDLARVRCPTLVVRGDQSPLFSAATQARMVDELLDQGSAAVVQAAGHAMMIDNPDGLRRALSTYLLS